MFLISVIFLIFLSKSKRSWKKIFKWILWRFTYFHLNSQDMLLTYIFYKLTCLTCFLKCHFNFYPSLPLIALLSLRLCIFSESLIRLLINKKLTDCERCAEQNEKRFEKIYIKKFAGSFQTTNKKINFIHVLHFTRRSLKALDNSTIADSSQKISLIERIKINLHFGRWKKKFIAVVVEHETLLK